MTDARVLVVEDNVKNMKLFRDVLEAAGFRTLAATTAGEAVDVAAEQGPDLVEVAFDAAALAAGLEGA